MGDYAFGVSTVQRLTLVAREEVPMMAILGTGSMTVDESNIHRRVFIRDGQYETWVNGERANVYGSAEELAPINRKHEAGCS